MEALQISAKNMEKKKLIRKEIIARRLQMSEAEVRQKSKEITKMVLELQEYHDADTIFCYVDFRNEVQTREIIEDAWRRKKCVAVPKVEETVMNFYQIDSWEDLSKGTMKIEEPKNGCRPVDSIKGFMIMPGVAFDKKGHRIGYGGGYYDKYLSENQNLYKVAVAFENQMYDELSYEEHDQKPDIIITEKRILTGE